MQKDKAIVYLYLHKVPSAWILIFTDKDDFDKFKKPALMRAKTWDAWIKNNQYYPIELDPGTKKIFIQFERQGANHFFKQTLELNIKLEKGKSYFCKTAYEDNKSGNVYSKIIDETEAMKDIEKMKMGKAGPKKK